LRTNRPVPGSGNPSSEDIQALQARMLSVDDDYRRAIEANVKRRNELVDEHKRSVELRKGADTRLEKLTRGIPRIEKEAEGIRLRLFEASERLRLKSEFLDGIKRDLASIAANLGKKEVSRQNRNIWQEQERSLRRKVAEEEENIQAFRNT